MSDAPSRPADGPVSVAKEGTPRPPATGLVRRSLRYGQTRLGLVLLVVVVAVMLLGPLVAPFSPTEFVATPASAPGDGALFGTDALGRDVWSRFLHGGLTVLWMSVASALVGELLGVVVGLVASMSRSWLDKVLMRSSDVVLAFPQIVLALLFVSLTGPNLAVITLLVALSHAPRVARLVRATAMDVSRQDYVLAADALGIPRRRIMLEDILPNLTTPLLVDFGLRLIWSIGIIAGLSFVGLGIQAPQADWGLMINENRGILASQPWAIVLPTIGIAVLAVAVNLVTEGVSRAVAGIDRESA
jgi:peptide/nickel transport system permease protein